MAKTQTHRVTFETSDREALVAMLDLASRFGLDVRDEIVPADTSVQDEHVTAKLVPRGHA